MFISLSDPPSTHRPSLKHTLSGCPTWIHLRHDTDTHTNTHACASMHTRTHVTLFLTSLSLFFLPPFFTLYSPFSSALSGSYLSLTKQLAPLPANWGGLLQRGARQSAWWGIKWWLINLLLSWSSNWELYETPSSQPAQPSTTQPAHTHTHSHAEAQACQFSGQWGTPYEMSSTFVLSYIESTRQHNCNGYCPFKMPAIGNFDALIVDDHWSS